MFQATAPGPRPHRPPRAAASTSQRGARSRPGSALGSNGTRRLTRTTSSKGIRLLEVARGAREFYRTHGQVERAALMSFILAGSTLKDDQLTPSFKPPFDIIHRIAQETKKAAPTVEAACPILLPRTDSNQRP
jgi:hypothetical protein